MATKQKGPELGWWGDRWLNYTRDVLEAGPATPAAEKSARKAPTQLRITPGQIIATVAVGNYGNFQTASYKMKPITERQWRQVLDAAAQQPEVAQRLLNGNPGADLEALMAERGLSLFPEPTRSMPLRCSCGALSCRHLNALAVHVADMLDANPFLWLEVRGMDRAHLQAGIRARLTDTGPTADQPVRAERFWATESDPDQITVRPGGAVLPDALLRRLGPLPLRVELSGVSMVSRQGHQSRPVDQVLRRLVSRMGKQAAALGRGERAPAYQPWATPGKPIPTGLRLTPEVVEAVRAEGRILSLELLRERCPTAAALPDDQYRLYLADSLQQLPPDLIRLGYQYVGVRETVLAGAAFSHVITFGEWRRGGLSPDADWMIALQIAGHEAPYRYRLDDQEMTEQSLWAALAPLVGDELWLTVSDPGAPVLEARLLRRSQRSYFDRDRASAPAARDLAHYLLETGEMGITEEDAIGLLLGGRHHGAGKSVDPVWLMPFHTEGLHNAGPERMLIKHAFWRPNFGRAYYGHVSDEDGFRRFQALLMQRGESRKRIEQATQILRWWWQNAGADEHAPPPLAALLEFLWVSAPRDGARSGISLESLPATLADWFTVLAERQPALRASLADHFAACSLVDAYAQRLRTLPVRAGWEQFRSWEAEGYRWMGPEHFFARGPVDRRW